MVGDEEHRGSHDCYEQAVEIDTCYATHAECVEEPAADDRADDSQKNIQNHAFAAALQLLPVNAPGSATGSLPAPIYCPGLFGATDTAVERVMQALPEQACQRAAATVAFTNAVRQY